MALQFFSDSILNGQAVLNYPETDVHFLIGAQVRRHRLFEVTGQPANTGHVTKSTPDGVTALLEAITTYCQ